MAMTFNLICQCMYMAFDTNYSLLYNFFFWRGGNNSSENQQCNVIFSITVNGQENESRTVIKTVYPKTHHPHKNLERLECLWQALNLFQREYQMKIKCYKVQEACFLQVPEAFFLWMELVKAGSRNQRLITQSGIKLGVH